MSRYKVTISETLEKEVFVDAENEVIKKEIVSADWRLSKHILSTNHFTGLSFTAHEIQRERGRER